MPPCAPTRFMNVVVLVTQFGPSRSLPHSCAILAVVSPVSGSGGLRSGSFLFCPNRSGDMFVEVSEDIVAVVVALGDSMTDVR